MATLAAATVGHNARSRLPGAMRAIDSLFEVADAFLPAYSQAMAGRRRARNDFDSPWKEALQRYFQPFLAFFYPAIYADIDWARGYDSLDKEFLQVVRRAKVGKGIADKLFKVWLRDGSECWLLIQVEVQATYDATFAERMFRYNLAAYALYNRAVVSLAVLCDDNPHWRPKVFNYGRWSSRTGIEFLPVKLLDHAGDLAALEASVNPFAPAVLAQLQALATQGDPRSRQQWKLRIVKGLYGRSWTADDVRELFRVIDWILELSEALQEVFRNEMYQFEEEQRMPYVTSIERMALKKGREEGREEGRVEARAQRSCSWGGSGSATPRRSSGRRGWRR